MNPVLHLSASDWLSMFNHYASLSLLAVGGPSPPHPTCTAIWWMKRTG